MKEGIRGEADLPECELDLAVLEDRDLTKSIPPA